MLKLNEASVVMKGQSAKIKGGIRKPRFGAVALICNCDLGEKAGANFW